jgi:hypothetical protein
MFNWKIKGKSKATEEVNVGSVVARTIVKGRALSYTRTFLGLRNNFWGVEYIQTATHVANVWLQSNAVFIEVEDGLFVRRDTIEQVTISDEEEFWV